MDIRVSTGIVKLSADNAQVQKGNRQFLNIDTEAVMPRLEFPFLLRANPCRRVTIPTS